jgi:hypothetical protein
VKRITVILLLLIVAALGMSAQQRKPSAKARRPVPALKIIQDSLHQSEYEYFVKGTVYNPHDKAVKNVVIKYYIWKKLMGAEDSKLTQQDAEAVKAKLKSEIAAYREQIEAIKATPATDTHTEVEAARQVVALQRKILDAISREPRPAQTGGLVTANLKYIPPKQSVDFTATGCCADVMTSEMPDPLSGEITAEWDQ